MDLRTLAGIAWQEHYATRNDTPRVIRPLLRDVEVEDRCQREFIAKVAGVLEELEGGGRGL